MENKIVAALAVIGVLLGGWSLYSMHHFASVGPKTFGATTAGNMLAEQYIPLIQYNGGYNSAKDINTSAFLGTTGTFLVGSSGTTLSLIGKGTCSLVSSAYTVAASSTAVFSCAVTASATGDIAFAGFATSTVANNIASWQIVGAIASTTASNDVEIRVWNGSGASNVIPAEYASSTRYLILR